MSAAVRRAGHATLADGSLLVWSVADGRRGRRWRATTTRDGALTTSLLLEVGLDGRPLRLELATSAGLLTVHPEPSGELHGNAVTADGVRHLTFAWSGDHALEIEGLPIASAVTAFRIAGSTAAGERRIVPVVAVAADLSVRESARRFLRVGEGSWTIEGEGAPQTLTIDDDGLPIATDGAGDWPLERDS